MANENLIAAANELNNRSSYQEALDLLSPVLKEEGTDYALLVAQGNAFYGLRRFEEAEKSYSKASRSNTSDVTALSNLAGVYFETARYEKGLDVCDKALLSQPENTTLLIHRGNMLSSMNRYAEAAETYARALKIAPEEPLILFNLAYARMMTGQVGEAEEIYRRLLQIKPNEEEYLYAYASFLEKTENFAQAADVYLKALQIRDDPTVHITLGGCLYNLQLLGQTDEVLELTDKWLAAFPENPAALHMLETIKNTPDVKRASVAYVQELFDAFADSFDSVLEGLEYQAPALIADEVKTIAFASPPVVLDLGCGTGLCAAAMKEREIKTASFSGIDLSSGMLKKAKERGLYSRLYQGDITAFTTAVTERFDLIVSADVLTYLGDLSAVFSELSVVIKPAGKLVFTISENTQNNEDYTMEPSGRFMHSKEYIRILLEKNGFDVDGVRSVELRQELGIPVKGLLFVAKKKI